MQINEILQKQFLTFSLGNDEYAVQVLRIKEILEYENVTRVPNTPRWVRGVFNLRGNVIPVIDLAVKFGFGHAEITKTTCIVVVELTLEDEPVVMGMLVDSVSEVIDLSTSDIKPAPAFGAKVDLQYLLGVVKIGKRLALLLDTDKILSAEELPQVESAALSATQESAAEIPQLNIGE